MTLRYQGVLVAGMLAISALCSRAWAQIEVPMDEPAQAEARETVPAIEKITLADSPNVERQTLTSLLRNEAWPKRALAAMRLERFDCDETKEELLKLIKDPAWQVRAFALRSLGRRGVELPADWMGDEAEPRVVRAGLRNRYSIEPERLGRGVRALSRSNDLEELMLAVELALPAHDEDLTRLANELVSKIIFRMGRTDAGTLSPRLAAITGQPDMRRHYLWQQWYRKAGRAEPLKAAYAVPELRMRSPRSLLAEIDAERFAALERYIGELGTRRVDLALCMDCTASMWAELADAQGSMDDLMLFAGDVAKGLRVGLVAYRDRREDFEVKFWDFTASVPEARTRLWSLTAEGGGDYRESVSKAMRAAFTQLTWDEKSIRRLIVIGDAPPHVGTGTHCVEYAKRAKEAGVITDCIQASKEPVEFFEEIAKAGDGKAVTLDEDASLVAEITGLSLGDKFEDEMREFFLVYLELCR